jgi:hypothetical protein
MRPAMRHEILCSSDERAALPPCRSWVHYLSVFFFAFEAMISNEVVGLSFDLQVGNCSRGGRAMAGSLSGPQLLL